jgi:hypothetical protein
MEKVSIDMAPIKKPQKPQKAAKKEKIFHPESRKAGQLARKQLRKSKLAGQASKRGKLHSSKGKLSETVHPLTHKCDFLFYSRFLRVFLPRYTRGIRRVDFARAS